MKKILLSFLSLITVFTAMAQVNYRMQTACHPQDAKNYDTKTLRERFMMEKVMVADEITVLSKKISSSSSRSARSASSSRASGETVSSESRK